MDFSALNASNHFRCFKQVKWMLRQLSATYALETVSVEHPVHYTQIIDIGKLQVFKKKYKVTLISSIYM